MVKKVRPKDIEGLEKQIKTERGIQPSAAIIGIREREEPFPTDGSLYDLGDGKLYQTEDGYTFHPVGDISLLQNGCSNGACSATLNALPTTTKTRDTQLSCLGS